MKIKLSILTKSGIKEAALDLNKELTENFGSPVRCYYAAANVAKVAKQCQDTYITPEVMSALIEQHQDEIAAHKAFDHDGVLCCIKEKISYNFDSDETYKKLSLRATNAKNRLDRHKAKMIADGTAVIDDTVLIFEARGEAKK